MSKQTSTPITSSTRQPFSVKRAGLVSNGPANPLRYPFASLNWEEPITKP